MPVRADDGESAFATYDGYDGTLIAEDVLTNEQPYLAIGIPILTNAALIGLLLAYINSRFDAVDKRFDAVDRRFSSIDKRFDDMRELWRAELRRVEEVLDARLKHVEEAIARR
ncbi:MAG: hypothetical protein IT168_09950 [Bryobacterales bacterium]|nr:hypothetical protein [Bryobacterales bacterium]